MINQTIITENMIVDNRPSRKSGGCWGYRAPVNIGGKALTDAGKQYVLERGLVLCSDAKSYKCTRTAVVRVFTICRNGRDVYSRLYFDPTKLNEAERIEAIQRGLIK